MMSVTFLNGLTEDVADEQDIVEWVTEVRRSFGLGAVHGLVDSRRKCPHSCLIANLLNIQDEFHRVVVHPRVGIAQLSSSTERTFIQGNLDVLGNVMSGDMRFVSLYLPSHVAQAAVAFDEGVAFGQYASGPRDQVAR